MLGISRRKYLLESMRIMRFGAGRMRSFSDHLKVPAYRVYVSAAVRFHENSERGSMCWSVRLAKMRAPIIQLACLVFIKTGFWAAFTKRSIPSAQKILGPCQQEFLKYLILIQFPFQFPLAYGFPFALRANLRVNTVPSAKWHLHPWLHYLRRNLLKIL